MRTGHDVGDDLRLGRVRDRWFQHADDGRRAITETHCFADDGCVTLQGAHPEAVGQHDSACGCGAVIGRPKQTAEDRTQPHHAEIRTANHAGANNARLTEADQREFDRRKIAERRHTFDPGLQIPQFRHREGRVLLVQTAGALTDVDQPVLILVRERTQQHSLHDGEDGGVGADAQRQGQHDGQRQAPHPGERPRGVPKISE